MQSFPKKKITPMLKEILLTTEEVTTSEDVDKGPKHLDDKKQAVVTTPQLKKLLTTEKIKTSEEVDKGTKILDDNKEAVVTTPPAKKNY